MSYYIQLNANPNVTYIESNQKIITTYQLPYGEYVNAIDNLISIMRNTLPIPLNKNLTIIHDQNFESPECFKESRIIFIQHALQLNNSTIVTFPFGQLIFQLAHELCHITFGEKLDSRIHWFEEALCNAAALFFLKQMCDDNQSIYNPHTLNHASLLSYWKSEFEKPVKNIDLKNFNQFDSIFLLSYINEPSKAYADNFISLELLKAINGNNDFWSAIPELQRVDIDACKSLCDVINLWINASPSLCMSTLFAIAELFQPTSKS